jgi:hypothetical protein
LPTLLLSIYGPASVGCGSRVREVKVQCYFSISDVSSYLSIASLVESWLTLFAGHEQSMWLGGGVVSF